LAAYEGLDQFRIIRLTFNPITDQSLKLLSKLRRLKLLDLTGTNVNRECVAELAKTSPHIQAIGP
jgi:hypothetical protein